MEKPWLNRLKSAEERANLLLEVLSLDDKLAIMHGGVPSVQFGIQPCKLSDGPGGVTSGESAAEAGTQMPAPIALAATFDPDAAHEYGMALGKESAARGITILLAPTVNIARSALNGRSFESYGEDPYLSSRMGVEFVRGVQQNGVIANVKHYAANNQETDRFTQNSVIDERTLREIYLPAFEAAVVDGKVGTVMASYNKINGVAGTEHRDLLTNILKQEWGFDGFVISDFLAVQSTMGALYGGLDYELTLPFRRYFGEPLKQAVQQGEVPMEMIDAAVYRIMRTVFRFTVSQDAIKPNLRHPESALRTALESIVLLKNEDCLLPLSKERTIAVIGQAASSRMIASGGGSAHVVSHAVVSPLEGITRLAGDMKIVYAPGTAPVPTGPNFMYDSPNGDLIISSKAFNGGLVAEYYATYDLSGKPVKTESVPNLHMTWSFGASPPCSARWKGQLMPDITGGHTFYLPSSGGSRLLVDGQLVIDNWDGKSFYGSGEAMLEAGKIAEIEIHFTSKGAPPALPCISLQWHASSERELIAEAVQAALRSDVAIVFANDFMTENYDKPNLSLPGAQDSLIKAVADANPNTVVVLNTGGPVLMPWIDDVRAVLQLWYPGQEGGNALASVLFGEYDASGRLPVTFPAGELQSPAASTEQFPGIGQTSLYTEGLNVGYRWYDAHNEKPLFPFGHGLSYADFIYENLVIERQDDSCRITFRVSNKGKRTGKCVPQLYLAFPVEAGEPPKQLKAFKKVMIRAGESIEIDFRLDRRAFSIWCAASSGWAVPEGEFQVLVGNSSCDIALQQHIMWREMKQPRAEAEGDDSDAS